MTALRGTERLTIVFIRGSYERVATYAQPIMDDRKRKAPSRSATSRKTATPAEAAPVAPPAANPDERERLTDELRRVNQQISKLAREARPGSDPLRHSQLPEKQELLARKLDLERRIRNLTRM
jgi:hypothetical protein